MSTRLSSLLRPPRPSRRAAGATAVVLALGAALALQPGGAAAVDQGSLSFASATTVGIHNTYNQGAYTHLDQALDAGASLVELDVWADFFTGHWVVSHDSLFSDSNNCTAATTLAGAYTGSTNQDLGSCLDDIRLWLAGHPTANPIMVKIELKAGFQANDGMGPAQLDAYIKPHMGNLVFRPVDLLTKSDGSQYATLDAAAKAGNWPTRSALQGKATFEIIPGTVEENNPFDSLWTDVEYSTYLKGLKSAGTVANAEIFPSVHNAQTGDPRTRYSDTTIRPWFVVFDGDANTYVNDGNTEWYNTNHYLVIATDAQNVTPAISDTAPSLADAQARVALLAKDSVSYVSTDWTVAPGNGVLSEVLPRG
jgi:hypothetical protein